MKADEFRAFMQGFWPALLALGALILAGLIAWSAEPARLEDMRNGAISPNALMIVLLVTVFVTVGVHGFKKP